MLRTSGRRWVERFLLIAGIFCLGTALTQRVRYEAFERIPAHSPASPRILGRLEIPRLSISVAVLEGDSDENLALGAAHLSDTAPLGSNGNAAIAGHRDLAFRALAAIRPGDKVVIRAVTDVTYRVTSTTIVNPSDTAALADDGRPRLTLITCYPFHYIGSAPQRFIVRADLESP